MQYSECLPDINFILILTLLEFITCSYFVHQKMEIFHKTCGLSED